MRVILIALAAFIIGWEVLWWIMGVRPISPMRLKRMLQASTGNKPVLIDVRTTTEFNLFHIEGAESVPNLFLSPGAPLPVEKESPLAIICLSGHRSPVVGYRLKGLGFKRVYYLSWGMLAWMVSGGHVQRF